MRKLTSVVSAVITSFLLLALPAFAQTSKAPATGAAKAKALQNQEKRITQAQREAAAAARKKMVKQQLTSPTATRTLEPTPGGIPDYVGDPNWANSPPIRKFIDALPGLGAANANGIGQFISVAVPDTVTYPGSDYYELEVQQFAQKFHTDLDPTTLRGYVQVNKGTDSSGKNTIDPAPIRYLGPLIIAQKNRPVRIKFTNMLPVGEAGKLFVPVDKTVMGSGMGPLEMDGMRQDFTENRAVIHLHGGRSPWISDGTPHQWITPAMEMTAYPEGVSKVNVPDMPDPGMGSQTYYFTNQQSARLLFYHDHSWGITRLNVYVGEVAGYLIKDDVEQQLISDGIIPAQELPLIIQDKSFVDPATVRVTDPTWNWGSLPADSSGVIPPKQGDLWYPHVYVPAQNPYDLSGANPFGRWHYGPWFWPPTTGIEFPPVPNPYYDPINAPWQPPEMPGTPNPSMPGESFFDVATVNGCAYPTFTVQPRSYRFRILNASNDRFWNLSIYEADPTQVSTDGRENTEIAMLPARITDGWPESWPTDGRESGVPDPTKAGPPFIQIGSEGGFLPKPVVVPAQPIVWNSDPTTFNFGNVSDHALLIAPAERADVIVDFSAYAGKTLILYNDAPAAFPALDTRYDYYAGAPDKTETGGYTSPQIGFAPNTRTVMQINVAAATPADPFDLDKLSNAFKTTEAQDGVFKRSQDPIIVGQSSYDSAYNTEFPTQWPLWGYARIHDKSMTFRTLAGTDVFKEFEPKAIQDEMGEAFDEYGRMEGALGLELKNTSAFIQNFVLQAYVDPPTEIIADCVATGIATADDGTQIWKITHNGVDTHPIHFHLFDVQVLNRVGWDGAIRLPDDNELGWKETVRVSPLEDTIVALRPVAPKMPFGLPDSIRPLNPMEPLGSMMGFSTIDPFTGLPLAVPTVNEMANFGWEYVWHCHILSHEEMDMMRPIKFNVDRELPDAPVLTATGTTNYRLAWSDGTPAAGFTTPGNPKNEIGFRIERSSTLPTGPYTTIAKALANTTIYVDTSSFGGAFFYRVVAYNAAGEAPSNVVAIGFVPPIAPSGLTVSPIGGDVLLAWVDNSNNETGFTVQRAQVSSFSGFTTFTVGAGVSTFTDYSAAANRDYYYRVRATNPAGPSGPSNTASILASPTSLTGAASTTSPLRVTLNWLCNSNLEDSFEIQRAKASNFSGFTTLSAAANATSFVDTTADRSTTYYYRMRAKNASALSRWSNTVTVNTPSLPAAPTNLVVVSTSNTWIRLGWTDNANNETGFYVQRSPNGTSNWTNITPAGLGSNTTGYLNTGLARRTTYYYRVWAYNAWGSSAVSNVVAGTTE